MSDTGTPTRTTRPRTTRLSPVRAVGLIAGRELRTQLRTKSFLISNTVVLVIILGGIVAASIFLGGGEDEPTSVGLVGEAGALSDTLTSTGDVLGTAVRTTDVDSEQTARDQVSAGDLDIALVPGMGGAVTAVVQEDVDPTLRTVLDAAVQQQATDTALAAEGVDPAALAAATQGAVVTVDALDPPDAVDGERLALAYVAVLLLYFQLLVFGLAVATGVVEEKTSRVVELLLSTVKPLHLLTGKIVGIGLTGLLQLTAYGLVGLGAGIATGLVTATGTAVAVFASTLGWFVLGFAFFAVLYAAAGSLVSRQEEIGSTTTPLTILVVAMFIVAQTSVQDPGGTLSSVMSWIPPFSAILMPLRIAAGVASPVQVVVTVLLMLAVTAVLAVLAARIYRRSVLRSGTRVSWKEAFART